MRIGVDAGPLAGRRTGIGHYLAGLLSALAAIDSEHEVILYALRPFDFTPLPQHWRIRVRPAPRGAGSIWPHLTHARMVLRDQVDLYWGAHFLLPFGLPRSIPAAVTVYDLTPFLFPRTMELRNYLVTRLLVPRSLARAQRIMVISDSVAADLRRIFPGVAGRVSVVPPGVRAEFLQPPDPQAALRRVAALGLDRSYVLTVGTVEPRKNLQTLLRAWRAVPARLRGDTVLAIAGARGWRSTALYAEAHKLVEEGAVRFLGYVPDDVLPCLYAGALAFVFPSLYEGFGMPVIEALASGVPVIGSDIPAVREIAGEATVYVPPADVVGWTDAICQVLAAPADAAGRRTLGRQRAARYTFERSAAVLRTVLEGLRPADPARAVGTTHRFP